MLSVTLPTRQPGLMCGGSGKAAQNEAIFGRTTSYAYVVALLRGRINQKKTDVTREKV